MKTRKHALQKVEERVIVSGCSVTSHIHKGRIHVMVQETSDCTIVGIVF